MKEFSLKAVVEQMYKNLVLIAVLLVGGIVMLIFGDSETASWMFALTLVTLNFCALLAMSEIIEYNQGYLDGMKHTIDDMKKRVEEKDITQLAEEAEKGNES